jgi:hypothetical protein
METKLLDQDIGHKEKENVPNREIRNKEDAITFHVSRFTSPLSWLALALCLGLFYLAISAWQFGFVGFPLDDAWIHQTYARNLALSGQMAFTPGVPSAGSTSPLWSLLLSLGYLLRLPFHLWTYGLGLLFLGLTGWTVNRLAVRLFPDSPGLGLWTGLFAVFEWHLIWAAVSGMETILFVWLSLLLVERYLASVMEPIVASGAYGVEPSGGGPAKASTPSPVVEAGRSSSGPGRLALGLLAGLLILTRPEGIGLVGLIGLDIARRWRQDGPAPVRVLLLQWTWIIAGLLLIVGPYVAFHLQLTGLPFPNTLYAKQAEYREILEYVPLWQRLFGDFGPPVESIQGVFRVIFIGAQLLLLPGLIFAGWLSLKERRWATWLVWSWWVGYLLLYGLRLPVTYQHGRYQIPAIAWVVLLGIWGTARLVGPSPQTMLRRVAGRVLVISLVLLAGAFVVVGAQAYGRDVRFIETEMVAAAKWLDQHVAPQALLAAHDIGAIGYFSQRRLIDLAGLITPEVIPFIRDEAVLFDFMIARQVDYFITFPSWYPQMTQQPRLRLRYQTGSIWTPQLGGDNMAVYEIMD